jgi:murein DD-endopeptidase MepM/ murein hydrolase activator NlpD
MDGVRFDDFARTLALGQSRRSLLRIVAGSTLGGVLAAFGIGSASGACQSVGAACGSDDECCSAVCSGGLCAEVPVDQEPVKDDSDEVTSAPDEETAAEEPMVVAEADDAVDESAAGSGEDAPEAQEDGQVVPEPSPSPTGGERVGVAVIESTITLPVAGMVTVTANSVAPDTACDSAFGIVSPISQGIFASTKSQVEQSVDLGAFEAGATLVFALNPLGSPCAADTYLSTDPDHARIDRLDDHHWRIFWEDLPPAHSDFDYDDFVVDITLNPVGCGDGLTECNGICIDTQTDPKNCGSCGFNCLNVSPNMACVGSACICREGFAFCGDPGTGGGVCTDRSSDPNHCGRCGRQCRRGQECVDGVCRRERPRGLGGTWISPSRNFDAQESRLQFAAHAFGGPDGSGVAYVNFTAWWTGINSRVWAIACRADTPIPGSADEYRCEWPITGAPNGEVKASFDVYDNAGNWKLAPDGKRAGTIRVPWGSVFDHPIGERDGTGRRQPSGWDIEQGFNGTAVYGRRDDRRHAGVDWQVKVGSKLRGDLTIGKPVYPIAPGKVAHIHATGTYPGDVVILEHQTARGLLYSVYAHIQRNQDLAEGQSIKDTDTVLGTIVEWSTRWGAPVDNPGNSHLHFEIRSFLTDPEVTGPDHPPVFACGCTAGPGYWLWSRGGPAAKGWLSPNDVIDESRRAG